LGIDENDRDQRAGFLIKDNFVTVISQGVSGQILPSQFGYSLSPEAIIPQGYVSLRIANHDTTIVDPEEIPDTDDANDGLLMHFLGSTFANDKAHLTEPLRNSLLSRYRLYIDAVMLDRIHSYPDPEKR